MAKKMFNYALVLGTLMTGQVALGEGSSVEQRLQALEAENRGLQNQVATMVMLFNEMKAEIKPKVDQLGNRLEVMENQLSRYDVADMSNQIAILWMDMSDNEDRVTSLQVSLDKSIAQMTAFYSSVAATQQEVFDITTALSNDRAQSSVLQKKSQEFQDYVGEYLNSSEVQSVINFPFDLDSQ